MSIFAWMNACNVPKLILCNLLHKVQTPIWQLLTNSCCANFVKQLEEHLQPNSSEVSSNISYTNKTNDKDRYSEAKWTLLRLILQGITSRISTRNLELASVDKKEMISLIYWYYNVWISHFCILWITQSPGQYISASKSLLQHLKWIFQSPIAVCYSTGIYFRKYMIC